MGLATAAERIAALPRWALLLLAALAARAITFGNPVLHVDEGFYLEAADAWLHGQLPYADVWDRKPVGLFALYAFPALFGVRAGVWIYQAMALACAVGTALGIARLAERAGWGKGATWGGIAYLVWLNLLEGQGGQAPVFYNLLMVGAVLLASPRDDDAAHPGRRFRTGLAAMALVGIALQIKYSALFEGLFLGLWLMWREWRCGRSGAAIVRLAALWAGAALVPTALAMGAYAAIGQLDAFVFANFTSIGSRNPDPALELIGNLGILLLITSPLIAMAVLAARLPGGAGAQRRYLLGWLIASALGVLIFGGWFDHYALPLLAPLCTLAAGFIGDHRDGRRWALPAIALFALGGQVLLTSKLLNRGTPEQYAALAGAIGRGPGCLYVYSGTVGLYARTGRCAVTRYWFPSHLGRAREAGAIGVDQKAEIARIFEQGKPEIVVMRPPFRGELPENRALAANYVARDYKRTAEVPLGNLMISVFRRR